MDMGKILRQGLKEMKIDKKEMQPEIESPSEADVEYPYGLCIRLNKESLKMLNIRAADFKVGDKLDINGVCSVTGIRSTTGRHDMCEEVELQITHLNLEDKGKSDGN